MGAPAAAAEHGVRFEDVWKRYGDTVALGGLDLVARPGAITGIAGPNGAGKSTMVRVLAGETLPDTGSIRIDGQAWSSSAGAHEVAVVHQEPQLFPNLTVGDNLLVGREGRRWRKPALSPAELDLLDSMGIRGLANRRLGSVPLAVRQRVEIARALARKARVVIFDEPNSALTEGESTDLFREMRRLADGGRVVILVSHRLSELAAESESVTVILDGRAVRTLQGSELTEEAIAREIAVLDRESAGRSQGLEAATQGSPALHVSNWTHPRGRFRGVELAAPHGAIVAIMGVEGSGGRELTRSLAGLEPATGSIMAGGLGDRRRRERSTAYVHSDRRAGLFFNYSVAENIVARLDADIAPRASWVSRARMRSVADHWIDRLRVKTPSPDVPIGSLSGGNQQKVAIAAAMAQRPAILVLEEPTRGVDIGSKADIYRFLREYAAQGNAVVMYCTEVPEAYQAADIAYVVARGRVGAPLRIADFADEKALAAAVARLESGQTTDGDGH
jgi:ABC-type sugar transport system ATPase subunit